MQMMETMDLPLTLGGVGSGLCLEPFPIITTSISQSGLMSYLSVPLLKDLVFTSRRAGMLQLSALDTVKRPCGTLHGIEVLHLQYGRP